MKSWVTKASGITVALIIVIAILAPWIANSGNPDDILPLIKYAPEKTSLMNVLEAPTANHPLGTDYVGRDILSRLVHGARNSLFFALGVVLISMLIGMIIGSLMGYYGGVFDLIVSRIVEIIGNFPMFLLQLTLISIFPPGYGVLIFVMLIGGWIPYARLTRGEVLKLRNFEFIEAAKSVGVSPFRLFFRHLIPNALTPMFVYLPFSISGTIAGLGALSFLGFGEPINVASLGELLKQAKDYFREAWWLAVFPGTFLFMMTLSLALFGSFLRDYFDPREN